MPKKRPSTKPRKTNSKRTKKRASKAYDPEQHALATVRDTNTPLKRRFRLLISLLRSDVPAARDLAKDMAANPRLPVDLQDRLAASLLQFNIRSARAERSEARKEQQDEAADSLRGASDRTLEEIMASWPRNASGKLQAEYNRALCKQLRQNKQARLQAWRGYGLTLIPEAEEILEEFAVSDGIKPKGWTPPA